MESARQAYKAYSPRPFAREERDRVEILFGGLHWRAERVIQAVFENLGYRARPLPAATKSDLLLGRELADIGQCCPTSFTTGNLANFLRTEAKRIGPERVADKYVYVTAGACGACAPTRTRTPTLIATAITITTTGPRICPGAACSAWARRPA